MTSLNDSIMAIICESLCLYYFCAFLPNRQKPAARIVIYLLYTAAVSAYFYVIYVRMYTPILNYLFTRLVMVLILMLATKSIPPVNSLYYVSLSVVLVGLIRSLQYVAVALLFSSYQFSMGLSPVACLVFIAATLLLRPVFAKGGHPKMKWYLVISLLIMILPVLFASYWINLYISPYNKSIRLWGNLACTLIFLSAIFLTIFQERLRLLHDIETEAALLEGRIGAAYRQFMVRKETSEKVNQRYHDIKNHLICIAGMNDMQQVRDYIKPIVNDIGHYEQLCNTGNDIVDSLICDKLSVCRDNDISCVPYVDSTSLSFMQPSDVCAMFGNAFDNAIESAVNVSDQQKRLIRLKGGVKNGFFVLQTENYFDPEHPPLDDLSSTKPTPENHGYGLASIRQIAGKYGGSAVVSVEADTFLLTVMIPLDNSAKHVKKGL